MIFLVTGLNFAYFLIFNTLYLPIMIGDISKIKTKKIPIPHLLFVGLLIVLTFLSFISYDRINGLTNASNWVNHTNHTKLTLSSILINLVDAETGQRGYLLTNDSAFLDLYKDAGKNLNDNIVEIDSLTADNPVQQRNLKLIFSLINQRMSLLAQNVSIFKLKGYSADLKPQLEKGKDKMDEIRSHITVMMNLENILLAERTKEKDRAAYITPFYLFVFSVIALFIVTIAYFRLRSEIRLRVKAQDSEAELEKKVTERTADLKKLNAQLTVQNTIFEHAEENAGIGSYSWNLQTGILDYSDNLFRLLDCEPQEFVPSFEKFVGFIHPDDKEQVIKDGTETYETKKLVQHIYRVITKKGTLKYFRSSGNFTGEAPNQFLVGTVQDVTNDTQLSETLTAKNLALERNNAELASFSYIASHDLQEPLRKIQSFSKLILNNETAGLSEKSKDYFSRVISAAERMQNLIDALLNYSGAGNTEITLVATDLNLIIDEVKNNLHEIIEEKKVTIETSGLPIVKVIQLQFYQLFSNLIANAIKYSKKDIPPYIKISSIVIPGEAIEQLSPEARTKYWHISITDNGIGFDPQYENKIFELFQRLHGRREYEGTGIGLAICKKIIHNHNGFITASGQPGIGAVFNIYLPLTG